MTISPAQLLDLHDLAAAWPAERVLIGGAALGLLHGMPWRTTSDLDLVIAAELDDLERPLPPGWQRGRHEHQFLGARGTRFDIIPASPALRAAGVIAWRRGYQMNLAGLDLAFAHARDHVIDAHRLRVAPPPVVAVLKMVAYLDRPADRTRDLADLAHLLDGYIDDDDDRRWDEARGVTFDDVSAFLLGKDVGALLAGHRTAALAVEAFLDRVEHRALGEMRAMGPRTWRRDDDLALTRLAAFRRGVAAVAG